VGYHDVYKAYRMKNPQIRNIIIIKDVSFSDSLIGSMTLREKSSMESSMEKLISLPLESFEDELALFQPLASNNHEFAELDEEDDYLHEVAKLNKILG
jgi:hypothetical protein